MRSLMIASMLFFWMAFVLFKPVVGILLWDWVSHMVPHNYVFGFAQTFPFLDLVAVLTLGSLALGRDPVRLPAHPLVILLLLYLLWVGVTTAGSLNTTVSLDKLIKMLKVTLFAFLSILLMGSPNRLRAFLWVIGLSVAFITIKGGLFTIITGGDARVQGAGGMMGDNNQLAMAMVMCLPLFGFFMMHLPLRILRLAALGTVLLTIVAVLGTHSRGGLVALLAVALLAAVFTRRRVTVMAVGIPLLIAAALLMPDVWWGRMNTLDTAADTDTSFLGRVVMWKFAMNVVAAFPMTGGGFDVFVMREVHDAFLPPGHTARAAHSIYFEVLGEHGYIGLLLFLSLIFTGWFSATSAARRFAGFEETRWLADLLLMMRLSIAGFAAGGLTVNIATFDLFYHFLAVIVIATSIGQTMLSRGGLTALKDGEKGVSVGAPKKWAPTDR